jgi:hypothetical protein
MGVQARDVLRIWFGEKPEYETLDITAQMTSKAKDWFAKSGDSIFFLFTFGLQDGLNSLKKALDSRGINAKVIASRKSTRADGVFHDDNSSIFPDPAKRKSFREVCQRIGIDLLRARALEKGWSAEMLRERALGYSGAAQLVATSYNCPTIALTVLWGEGTVDGKEWHALFKRRFRG